MPEGANAGDVINVLRAHKVAVTLKDKEDHLYTLERSDFFEDVVLEGVIGKRYLFYLKRKLNIPISHFWNPDQAPSGD